MNGRWPSPRAWLGEAAGAVADLGVLTPLLAGLVLVNGLDAGSVLLMAGILVLVSGAAFGIPFPVQPLKALTAVAVAARVGPSVIHAAGLEIGLFLLLLSVKGVADAIARIFTKTVVRSLQLGVGLLLVIAAVKLVREPPALFQGTPPSPWPVVLGAAAFAGVVWSARRRHYVLSLFLLGAGIAAAWMVAHPAVGGPSFSLPSPAVPDAASFGTAFFLLVIPQLPLTFGNAVVAVNELAHGYFGPAAARVTASRVCLSCGIGNVASAVMGGMPMCHGAGGLTAHYRLGARTGWMNVFLGSAFVLTGLFFAPQVLTFLGLLPVWALAAFLAYAGLQHAFLVQDLRGGAFALALTGGVIGAVMGNLAITTGLVLSAVWGRQLVRGLRRSRVRTGRGPVAD